MKYNILDKLLIKFIVQIFVNTKIQIFAKIKMIVKYLIIELKVFIIRRSINLDIVQNILIS